MDNEILLFILLLFVPYIGILTYLLTHRREDYWKKGDDVK